MKKLTQEQVDNVKSLPVKDQVLFIIDLIEQGEETLTANQEIIKNNLAELFHLTFIETLNVIKEIGQDPDIENFTDEQGKEYIKNQIVNNVVSQMTVS